MGLILYIMGVYVPMVPSFRKSKNMVTKNPRSRSTIAYPPTIPKVIWRSRTYRRKTNSSIVTMNISKTYVQSFRSLALLLQTERENLLKTPRMYCVLMRTISKNHNMTIQLRISWLFFRQHHGKFENKCALNFTSKKIIKTKFKLNEMIYQVG